MKSVDLGPRVQQGERATPTATPSREPVAPAAAPKTGLDAVVANIPDSAIITGLVNVGGAIAVHEMFGVPYDLGVSLTFATMGTLIGAAYGPAKQALIGYFAGHTQAPGAQLSEGDHGA